MAVLSSPLYVPSPRAEFLPPVGRVQRQLAVLSFGREESRRIRSLISSNWLDSFEGDLASSKTLRDALERYRIIHVNAHGWADTDRPENSGLMLSQIDGQGRPIKGFVSVRDLLGWRTSADLVTLAACETALGKSFNGYGVMSLAAALLRSGASQVVATSWQIQDEASSVLMAFFYQALLQSALPAPEALRLAQVKMLKSRRWRARYFWGGFAVYGDASEFSIVEPGGLYARFR